MTTKPPRQRDGKPFVGGKKLRKALAKLAARNANRGKLRCKDHQAGSMK